MIEIGAQLFSLRAYTQTEADFARTAERVAQMGYKTVQLSAIGPIPAKTVKKICDDAGLRIVLTHNGEMDFLKDIDKLIEKHQIYDCPAVGIGSMPGRYRSFDYIDAFKQDFEGPAQKLHDAGFKFMYHNHAFEFAKLPDGTQLMDKLLAFFPADYMGIIADTYWLQFAGMPVEKWLKEHADRLSHVHLKDMTINDSENRMAPIGKGNIDFVSILKMLSENGVTKHALVELDNSYGESAFDCMKYSFDYLKSIGY